MAKNTLAALRLTCKENNKYLLQLNKVYNKNNMYYIPKTMQYVVELGKKKKLL